MASTARKNADFLRAVELPHISEKCYWAVAYWNECLLAVAHPAAAHRSSSLGRTSEFNRASGETFLSLITLNIFPGNSMGKRLCWIVGWRGEKGGEENVRAEELQPQVGALEEVLPAHPLSSLKTRAPWWCCSGSGGRQSWFSSARMRLAASTGQKLFNCVYMSSLNCSFFILHDLHRETDLNRQTNKTPLVIGMYKNKEIILFTEKGKTLKVFFEKDRLFFPPRLSV